MVRALIEVVPSHGGDLPVSLLHLAYRASARTEVVLVMPDDLRERVDRALDLVVTRDSLNVRGVRFVDVANTREVDSLARSARLVVAVSDDLRTRLRCAGVDCCDPSAAASDLAPRSP